jgi:flagellar basal-body rod protein FlgF
MDRLIFTSLKSVTEQRVKREMLTNELANVSTTGFKRSYESAMRTVKIQGPGFDSRFMPVTEQRDVINLEPGVRMVTARKLDVAMDGSTVMGVTAKDGQLAFTRRGDLRVSPTGVLENGEGVAVRGPNGPINVPQGFEIDVLADGAVFASDPNNPNQPPQQVGQILLRDASAIQLGRREDGLFKPFPQFANAEGDFQNGPVPPSLTPGTLEGSNVSPIEGMVRMLDQNRSFEAQIRIIKETRTLDESGSTMLRPGR